MRLLVNEKEHEITPDPVESLAETLRMRLHLTGTKVACARGECGSCTVLLNGRAVYSCLTITNACAGGSITTIEGLATPGPCTRCNARSSITTPCSAGSARLAR